MAKTSGSPTTTSSAKRTRPRRARSRPRTDLAAARRLAELLHAGADVRARKARRTGAAIRASRYENDLKLQIAIDRLLDELLA